MNLAILLCTVVLATSTNPHPPRSETSGRIMYWWGKVNQHVDSTTGRWETDPDGVSGADIDTLAYCQKWYPRTTSVVADKDVTITTWRERGNENAHTATRQSLRCVE